MFNDYTYYSYGIEIIGGIMEPLIAYQSSIPAKKSKMFTTTVDQQTDIMIKVLRENHFTKENQMIGNFKLSVPPAKKGAP